MVFLLFLNYYLLFPNYFLIPSVIIQIFIPIAEPVSPTGIPTKEAKAEMETHPTIVEITVSKWSI